MSKNSSWYKNLEMIILKQQHKIKKVNFDWLMKEIENSILRTWVYILSDPVLVFKKKKIKNYKIRL